MNANGSEPMRLTFMEDSWDDFPCWSPDGTKIAFHSCIDPSGACDVYVMDADGSNLTNLTKHVDSVETYPRWSPDGTKIAFASNRAGNFDIYVMDADGSNVTRLTDLLYNDILPAWSP